MKEVRDLQIVSYVFAALIYYPTQPLAFIKRSKYSIVVPTDLALTYGRVRIFVFLFADHCDNLSTHYKHYTIND